MPHEMGLWDILPVSLVLGAIAVMIYLCHLWSVARSIEKRREEMKKHIDNKIQ